MYTHVRLLVFMHACGKNDWIYVCVTSVGIRVQLHLTKHFHVQDGGMFGVVEFYVIFIIHYLSVVYRKRKCLCDMLHMLGPGFQHNFAK